LPLINILTVDAAINDEAPSKYQGMDRYVARKKIVADLDELGLLDKIDDHKLMVPRGDRSGQVVEPYLTDQWFVKTKPLAEPAIKAVEDGRIRFIPENWSKTYFDWMYNIQDWCISRQLWWGHRIPAWYDDKGNIYVGRDEAEVRKKHSLDASLALRQDEDVLDTWFSSALWPFSTLGWPQQTPELKAFYPGSVLVTGFDIIFFWVARMIMMGMKFTGDVPFAEVYIHGLIRDQDGQKMSKSKGNVLDPLDLINGIDLEALVQKRTTGLMQPQLRPKIEKATRKYFPEGIPEFGTDALRFTFAALASNGRDIRFDMGRIEGYRNFCNKIWNAARYVLMNTEGVAASHDPTCESLPDKWIRSRLAGTIADVSEHIEHYRLDLAAKALYEFTWNEYCDWYLELTKPLLLDDDTSEEARTATRRTLIEVLEALLRCLHPMIPFITEEIWQRVAKVASVDGDTIMLQSFPAADDFQIDEQAEDDLEWIKGFVLGIRQIRGEMDISPGKPLPVMLQDVNADDQEKLEQHGVFVRKLARLDDIQILDANDAAPMAATALLGNMKILVPMAGLIDVAAERTRLQKQVDKATVDLQKITGKLSNEKFVARAPEAVVAKERDRQQVLQQEIAQLEEQMAKLAELG